MMYYYIVNNFILCWKIFDVNDTLWNWSDNLPDRSVPLRPQLTFVTAPASLYQLYEKSPHADLVSHLMVTPGRWAVGGWLSQKRESNVRSASLQHNRDGTTTELSQLIVYTLLGHTVIDIPAFSRYYSTAGRRDVDVGLYLFGQEERLVSQWPPLDKPVYFM